MKAPIQTPAVEPRLQRVLPHSSAAIARVAPAVRARVTATRRDGTHARTFLLAAAEVRIGAQVDKAEVELAQDERVAPVHALIRFEGRKLVVEPLPDAPGGVFIALKERPLRPDDELMVGRQRLRVEWVASAHDARGEPLPGDAGRFLARAVMLDEDGAFGDSFSLKRGNNLLGTGRCEVTFPSEAVVSPRHASINVKPGQLTVRDLRSASGTFVRLNGRTSIRFGDQLLIGDHLLRFERP